MTAVEWEEPPQSAGGQRPSIRWTAVATELRERPGEWAMVAAYPKATTARTTAQHIRNGDIKPFRAGRWEAVTRGAKIYARYLGEGE